MKLHTASIAFLLVSSFAGLAAFGCSSSTKSTTPSGDDAGACGARPIGGSCKQPSGACEPEICVGTTWECPMGDTAVANTPLNCGASGDDGGTCGPREVGTTCKKPDGACEAEICIGSTWQCPAGDTSVPVVPGSCADESDGGSCGPMPIGSTCKKQGGTCEPLACIGTTWKCPAGETQVPVVPGSCDVPDAG